MDQNKGLLPVLYFKVFRERDCFWLSFEQVEFNMAFWYYFKGRLVNKNQIKIDIVS